MDPKAIVRKKRAKKERQTVKIDASLAPSLEDASEVHLLAEPKTDPLSASGVLYPDEDKEWKYLGAGEFCTKFDHGIRTAIGRLDSETMQGVDDGLNIGVLDGFLDGVEEVDDLHAADGLSSPCDDYLLDVEFPEQVVELDCFQGDGSRIGNSSSDIHSPGSTSSVGVAVPLKSSTLVIPEAECQNDMHKMTLVNERESIRGKFRYLAPVDDKMETPESQVLDDLENDSHPLASGVSLTEKCSNEATKIYSAFRLQRTRKPPKRYIEESLDLSFKSSRGRKKNSTSALKDKRLKTGYHDHRDNDVDHHARVRIQISTGGMESDGGSCYQMASDIQSSRGQPEKKDVMLDPEYEEESFGSESEDEHVSKKNIEKEDRRKFQIMWSVAEVTKLMDGVAHYGVGRWTDIKRHLFPLSTYRTPVDLRDKWRNLLRASGVHKSKGEDGLKRAGRGLPSSVLSRIAELAKLHPYPRDLKTKFVRSGRISVSIPRDASKGSSSGVDASK